jgi:hypothetical protein
MRRCFLKPAKRRLTVSREVPIIWPISSWVRAIFTWLGFLDSMFWSSLPTSRRAIAFRWRSRKVSGRGFRGKFRRNPG